MTYKILTLHGNLYKRTAYIGYIQLHETGGVWQQELIHHKEIPIAFTATINQVLQLTITAYNALNNEVSNKLSAEILTVISAYSLHHNIDMIANGGIVVEDTLTLGCNASIAALTELPVVGDFYSANKALLGASNWYGIASSMLMVDALASVTNTSIALSLLAALRWREMYNILSTQSKATRSHIAGGVWLGVEA